MSGRDRVAALALVILLALVGAGMLLPSTPPEPPGPTNAVGSRYREGILGHPSSINPLTVRTQADRDLVALLFRGLLKSGADGALTSDLAHTWTISPDGHTYTFLMRTDARWEDGEPVTAADVVFTVGLLQNAAYDGPLGASWQGVQAVADGTYAVHFTTNLPVAGFLRQATLPILPEHALAGVSVADLADSAFSRKPTGDGPFRIAELDVSHALLQAVPDAGLAAYSSATPVSSALPTSSGSAAFGVAASATASIAASGSASGSASPSVSALNGSGAISDLELRFFSDASTMLTQFQDGQLDGVGGLSPAQVGTATATPGARLVSYRWASMLSVILNQRTDHPEFRDPRVRRGLLQAIDRGALVSGVLVGHGTVAEAPIPSWSANYPTASIVHTPFDLLTAQTDLAAGGWHRVDADWHLPAASGVFTLKLLTPDNSSNPVVYAVAAQVAASWRAIGVDVVVDAVPAATFLDRLASGDYSAAVVDLQLGLDPDVSPLLLSTQVWSAGSNVSGIQDPALDKLLLAARKATDAKDRQAAIAALEKYVSTNLPILPLSFRDYGFVVGGRVQDVAATAIGDPSGRYWDVLSWRLANDG